jgi:PAS domain S-box-containing protein
MSTTLFDHLPGMLYRGLPDAARTMSYVAGACHELTGCEPEYMTASGSAGYGALIHPQDRELVSGAIQSALAARRRYDVSYRILPAHGGEKWVRERGSGVWSAAGEFVALEGFIGGLDEELRAAVGSGTAAEMFAKAFQSSPDSIVLIDRASGRIEEINEGFERLSGWTRADAKGRTSLELGLWRDEAERNHLYTELRAKGHIRDFVAKFRRRDGAHRDVVIAVELVSIGARERLLVVSRDVTDRLRAERALQESEHKFATAFQVSPFALVISDLESGRYLEVNHGFERIFGWTREEVLGRTTLELGIVQDRATCANVVASLEQTRSFRELELVLCNRRGEAIEGTCDGTLIELGGRECLLSTFADQTEQRKALRDLSKSKEKFAKAFHASTQSLIISELEPGRFLEVNAGFERIYGYSREEAIGRTAIELGLWPDPAERDEVVALLRQHGSMRARELRFIAKGGRPITVLLGLETIDVDGTPCVLAAGIDVTAEREAAEQQAELEAQLRRAQKLDALGQLAGGVAHDFNNLLTGIIGNADLALMALEPTSPLRRYLEEVCRAGERAGDLVRRILTFSRNQSPERLPTQLGNIVAEALNLLSVSLPATLEIIAHLDPNAPTVLADPTQIHQVVMNLGINAAQAMQQASGTITVTLDALQLDSSDRTAPPMLEPGRYARLKVSDTGCGMDENTLARIFEPFFTTKPPGEGTGLGLSVVHGIVEAHDGVMTVSSAVGRGATFEIFLPEHAEAASVITSEEAELPRGNGQHILVVDDEESVGKVELGLLQQLGYRVTLFSDPRRAWRAFETGHFDLVLSDITMPHLTGVELTRRILAARPGQPVLLASGHGGPWNVESIRALGARGLIAKPLTMAKLAHALHAALRTSTAVTAA